MVVNSHISCLNGSTGKSLVEIPVITNPCPDPFITAAERNGAIIKRYANGPKTRIGAKPFEMETRMGGVLHELLICLPSRKTNLRLQGAIECPELVCSP